MTKPRTFNLLAAAAYMGVKYQAVQQRFGDTYKDESTGRHRIPHRALMEWRKSRQAQARKLLASPQTETK